MSCYNTDAKCLLLTICQNGLNRLSMKHIVISALHVMLGIGLLLDNCNAQVKQHDSLSYIYCDTLETKVLVSSLIKADTLKADTILHAPENIQNVLCDCADTYSVHQRLWCKQKFEFRGTVFTDLVGLVYDQPNGLVQTHALFSYTRPSLVYETTPGRNAGLCKRTYFLRNIVLLDVTISKIASQDSELPVRYGIGTEDTLSYLNRFDLVQYAQIFVSGKINILTYKWPEVLSVYFDFIPLIYNTRLSDSLSTKEKNNVTTFAYGLNMKVITKESEKTRFSAEASFSFFRPVLYSQYYSDHASLQIKEPVIGNLVPHDKYSKNIQMIDIRIKHHPKNKKVCSFLKFSVVGNFIKPNDVPGNIFFQFQLGSGINFSNFGFLSNS